ncbi:MAG: membrane protein insertase YidC [Proteobacteria bacterium]|nr:membrane protein insertase YidC [Pseudomonadota bacterium]
MDTQKIALYAALFFVGLMLFTSWKKDYPNTPVQTPAQVEKVQSTGTDVNSGSEPVSVAAVSHSEQTTEPSSKQLITVKTNVLNIAIDRQGGNIIDASLLKYFQDMDGSHTPYVLFNTKSATKYVSDSGLTNLSKKTPVFTSSQDNYVMSQDQKDLTVTLRWQGNNGVSIIKKFHFSKDSYLVNVEYQITNHSSNTWVGNLYTKLSRMKPADTGSSIFQISAFTGASISDPAGKHYEKISFDKMIKSPVNRVVKSGWEAMQEHYFLTAWVPPVGELNNYYTHVSESGLFTVGAIGPQIDVAAGQEKTVSAKLYIGPESTDTLKAIAPGLELTVDYGFLWFIAFPIFWLMKQIYSIVGNWGWSIILVTVVIKLLFYHLSSKSYRSMAMMRKFQPKIEALKQRYGDDKQKMSQALMELYKKEKINPFGGCLPILIQIPVFIALYWVLLESVELRHAPFILWIKDLSAPDPYFVLPIIMGITMFVQNKLNPAPPDPIQAKMMMFLPAVFTVLFLYFPSGLVLYWVVNNIISILQQWHVNRTINPA